MTQTTTTRPEPVPVPKPAASPHDDRRVRIPHAPGLDGLRGLAVAAVVVFHAGPTSWLPGGFLGVSLFFTLSGYLITTLVLAEVRRDRQLAVGSFWARRMRRLVPALVVTTIGVVIASRFIEFGGDVRADLIGGLTYSANWVQVIRDVSYADLFFAPSPLLHLWSLAIEEQFYVVLPIAAWFLARRAPWLARNRMAAGSVIVVVAGVALSQLVDNPNLAYYGTLNRAPEIAIGVLLACRTTVTTTRASRSLTLLGMVALAISVAAWRLAGVTDGWIAGGGLAAFAVVSAVFVRAASRPGLMASALSFAPLRWLGLISYGLYLYHWPVVVIMGPTRLDWGPVALFGARVAISLALAAVSYWLIEQPLRRRWPQVPDRKVILIGFAALAVSLAIVLLAVPPAADQTAASEPAPAVVKTAPVQDPVVAGPPSVVLLGDSLPAFLVRDGGAALDPDEVTLVNGTLEACDGAEGAEEAKARSGALVPIPEGCTGWSTQYPAFFEGRADIAVLMVGGHAVLDRNIDGEFHGPCESIARDWYRNDLRKRLAYMQTKADKAVLVLPAWGDRLSGWINPADHINRTNCVRATMRSAAISEGVPYLDFGRYLCPETRDVCRPVRTRDGVHLDVRAAPDALQWVIDQSIDAP